MDAAKEAPQRRIIQGALSRIVAMDRALNSPGQHGPAQRRPKCLCATWGPISSQTARRHGSAGFEFLAPLVDPAVYLTPNYPSTVNPIVSEGTFWWCETGLYSDLSWTYTDQPKIINTDVTASTVTDNPLSAVATTINVVDGTVYPASGYVLIDTEIIQYTGTGATTLTGCTRGALLSTAASHVQGSTVYSLTNLTAPVAGVAAAGLFDPAIDSNGGAIILNNFGGNQQFSGAPVHPHLCCEIDLYDRTRGRSITSGRVPAETFMGGNYGFKKLSTPMSFEHGTEIEPRLYVTEAQMMAIMDETAVYLAASVAIYVTIVFKGFQVKRTPRLSSAGDPGGSP